MTVPVYRCISRSDSPPVLALYILYLSQLQRIFMKPKGVVVRSISAVEIGPSSAQTDK